MKRFLIHAAAILSLHPGIFHPLSAEEAKISSPEAPSEASSADAKKDSANSEDKKEKDKKSSETSEKAPPKQDQSRMAAWMIESAHACKDYVDALDRGLYLQSWAKADQLFQSTMTQKDWASTLEQTRKPMGRMFSRKILGQFPATDPKNLPKGDYMVVIYNSSFDGAPVVQETLTLRRNPEGKWKVLTYHLKNRSNQ